MGFIQHVVRHLVRWLLNAALRVVHYPHFHWIVQWDMTYRCNLRCSYCGQDRHMAEKDPRDVYPLVRSMRPKELILTGGEPMLCEGLEALIEDIRRDLNCFLVLNTNLMAHISRLERFFHRFDMIHFSFDGIDESNMATRGCSGRGVYRNFQRLCQIQQENRYSDPLWMALCMVTTKNWQGAHNVVQPLLDLCPSMYIRFATAEPPLHPLSVIGKTEIESALAQSLGPIVERDPERVNVVGPLAQGLSDNRPSLSASVIGRQNQTDNKADWTSRGVTCWRQFFRTIVLPDGRYRGCKPQLVRTYLAQTIRQECERAHYVSAARALAEMARILILKPADPSCFFPCKCEEYLEDVLQGSPQDPFPRSCLVLAERFSENEIEAAEAFMQQHLGHRMEATVRDALLGKLSRWEIEERLDRESSTQN